MSKHREQGVVRTHAYPPKFTPKHRRDTSHPTLNGRPCIGRRCADHS